MVRTVCLSLFMALVSGAPAFAEEAHHHHHGGQHREAASHVHGMANLQVALDGRDLVVELRSPLWNIVGFEHAPETVQQRRTLEDARKTFERVDNVMTINSAARCVPKEARVDMGGLSSGRKTVADADHDHDNEGSEPSYKDMTATYTFRCQAPAALSRIDLELFSDFENLERMKGVFLGTKGVVTRYMTGDHSHFDFKR